LADPPLSRWAEYWAADAVAEEELRARPGVTQTGAGAAELAAPDVQVAAEDSAVEAEVVVEGVAAARQVGGAVADAAASGKDS
jgi:hypothetical protein